MNAEELMYLSLTELSDRLANRDVSSYEVTQALLDRIKRLNPALNAFVTLDPEGALATARELDEAAARGDYHGPLHGVPIAHKDLYYTKRLRTTACSKLLMEFVPDHDATVVHKLREAGTVLLGKLNTHEFAYGPTGVVSVFGPSRNPWNTERMTGGSSGGSAAALAAGLCYGATGSDTGGSIRIPSSACGISGIKPTYGRCSKYGVIPLCWSMDHVGPMARTVVDLALLLSAMAGHDPLDPASAQVPVSDYRAALTGDLRGLRIGLPRQYFFGWGAPQVDKLVRDAVQVLEQDGAHVREVSLPNIRFAQAAALTMYLSEATAYHGEYLRSGRVEEYSDQVRTFIELGASILAKDYLAAQRFRRLLCADMAEVFEHVDIMITPTLPIVAPPLDVQSVSLADHDESVFVALLHFTEPLNLTGLPALSVPCGFSSEGLPVGMQLVGRAFDEATVLRVGHAYQQRTSWHQRRPLL